MSSKVGVVKTASKSADVELFLAVDTGGTKTAACLVDLSAPQDNCVLGRGLGTAGNPFSVGFAEATRAISNAIEQARSAGTFVWWLALYPGLAIFLTVFAYNLIGESMRDALDPKLRGIE